LDEEEEIQKRRLGNLARRSVMAEQNQLMVQEQYPGVNIIRFQ